MHSFESRRAMPPHGLAASRSIVGAGGESVNEGNTLRAGVELPESVRSRAGGGSPAHVVLAHLPSHINE